MPLPSDAPPSVQVPSLPPAFHSTWPPRPGNGSNGEFHILQYVSMYMYMFIYSIYVYIYTHTLHIHIFTLYTINYIYTHNMYIYTCAIIYTLFKYIYIYTHSVYIYKNTIYTYTYTRCGSAFALQQPWSLFIDAFGWPQWRLLTSKFYAQG